MNKYAFFSMVLILGLYISASAQTKECLGQDKAKNATTVNTSIVDSLAISKSIQIKPYKFNTISLNGPRIIVIDGKVSEQGFDKIEPKDIQSLSIVNSEKVASLYGYKNGSGVIIITTKRGANETKVEKELNQK